MKSLAALTALWPSVAEFARDAGIKPSHAHVMLTRGNISVGYWPAIIEAAEKRGLSGVTPEALLRLHTPAPDDATPAPADAD